MTVFAMPDPNPVMNVVLALSGSRRGSAELTADSLTVRLGRVWHATIPRASIRTAGRDPLKTISIGGHGWSGEWLVNTSTKGLVVLTIDPETTGRCLGYTTRLRKLHVSLADPDAFLADLGVPASA